MTDAGGRRAFSDLAVKSRRFRATALSLALLASCLLGACDPLGSDRGAVTGTPVPGSVGIDCINFDEPIVVSPDARWAAFWFAADRDAGLDRPLAAPLNRLALVDLDSFTVHIPQEQPAAASPVDPGLYGLCWHTDPAPGVWVHAKEGNRWYRIDFAQPDSLLPATPDPECEATRPPNRQWSRSQWDPAQPGPLVTRGLHVENPTPDSVTFTLDNGRELSHHQNKVRIGGDTRLSVDAYAWSADGEWLAYKLLPGRGNWAGPGHSYLVPRTGARKPIAIKGNTSSFAWAGDDLLLACVDLPGKDIGARHGIRYWRVPD